MNDELTKLIVAATRELAAEQGITLDEEPGSETRLFAEGGVLDSMALVSLVIAVEQAIEELYGVGIALADEKALSQRSSPYRSIGSLAAYAAGELDARRTQNMGGLEGPPKPPGEARPGEAVACLERPQAPRRSARPGEAVACLDPAGPA